MEEGICAERRSAGWMNGGYSLSWMVSSCCAKFNFLFKVALTSQQRHWRTGGLWLRWRRWTSRGWRGAGGMTQDLWVERAGGNGVFFTGGACHFPKGCNTRRACSHDGFTQIWLEFTPSAFAILPPVLEHSKPCIMVSWCSKTLNSPHLVLFWRTAAGQPCSPLPSLLPRLLSSDRRVWAGVRLRSGAALANEVHVSTTPTAAKGCWLRGACSDRCYPCPRQVPDVWYSCNSPWGWEVAPCLERAPGEDCTKCSDQNLQQCKATCVWVSLLPLMRFAKRICEPLGCWSAPFQEKLAWFIAWHW